MNEPDLTKTALTRRVNALEEALEQLRAERKLTSKTIETLQAKAYRDALTGLHNRHYLEERTSARGGYFVICDLDGFKTAQDAHPEGHEYGDRILREFAEFLVAVVRTNRGRSSDRVAVRSGGDEFVVWCPTRGAARRIKKLVRMWRSVDDAVGSSAGLGRDMQSADANLYVDKKRRKAGHTWSCHR